MLSAVPDARPRSARRRTRTRTSRPDRLRRRVRAPPRSIGSSSPRPRRRRSAGGSASARTRRARRPRRRTRGPAPKRAFRPQQQERAGDGTERHDQPQRGMHELPARHRRARADPTAMAPNSDEDDSVAVTRRPPPSAWWPRTRRLLGRLDRGVERLGRRDGPHPLAQAVLVVRQVADVSRRVLELRRPVQRVERADLDADAAVHAQRPVDVEACRARSAAVPPALGRRRDRLLVRVDVMHHDGHSRAQSMHDVQFSSCSAMTPRLRAGRSGLRVRVLRRDAAPRACSERHPEALRQTLAPDSFMRPPAPS